MSRCKSALAVAAAAAAAVALVLAASAAHDPARGRLRLIVQQQCLRHWLNEHRAQPCVSVGADAPGDPAGYAILHDRKGGAHFLLIATRTIAGIESPELQAPRAPNYFDAAWKSRDVLAGYLGRELPRAAVGLALNSRRARSQDQLHIHIECLAPGIFTALQHEAGRIGPQWSPLALDGATYQVLRIPGAQLGPHNPVQLLAAAMPPDLVRTGQYTLLVAGMQFADGPGFAVLASATARGAELLLDSRCAVQPG